MVDKEEDNQFTVSIKSPKYLDEILVAHGFNDFEYKGHFLSMVAAKKFGYIVHCKSQEDMNYCKLVFDGVTDGE